ncbi:MFS transporter [Streptomyces sp. NPDC058457]|uniref:MFS transporter n=1 Tax=Streptomyces sp. NPDC058457 TaxID=3346507 RepID=UPI003658E90E
MSSTAPHGALTTTDDVGGAAPYAKRWAAAIVMILAALLDMIDGSIVNTALPSIGKGLSATPAQLEWTVSAYMLGFAAALIIAGHLGDRFGRRKLFLAGVALFALASLAGAVAADPGQLIAARAVQGVSAAVLLPQVLGSFRVMFDGAERGRVFAVYGAIAGVAVAVGVLLGGVLTDWNLFGWGWRTVFAVNLPLAAVVLVLGARWIPEDRRRGRDRIDVGRGRFDVDGGRGRIDVDGGRIDADGGRIDVLGNLFLAAALVAIVLPLVEGRANGWPLWGWLCLAAGLAALLGLVGWESVRGVEHPLLPVGLFAEPAFSAGLLIQLLFYGGMSGFMMVFTIWLQSGQGYTPTQAGVLMVAFSAGAFLSAPMADGMIARFGRTVLVLGALLMVGGFWWLHHATGTAAAFHTGAWPLVPGLVVAGIGLGFLVVPLVNVVLTAVPADLAGGASGIFSTAQQFGGALGVAVIGNVFFSHADGGLRQAITHAGPWAVGAYALCAVLCLALPRRNLTAHPETH